MNKRSYPFIGILLGLILTGWWLVSIAGGDMPYLDEFTRGPVKWVAGTGLFAFFRFMTNFGSEFFMYPFTVTMTILLVIMYRDWLPAVIFAGGTLLGNLVNMGLKTIVARERPSVLVGANAEGFSYPSGHAMVTLIAYGLLLYFIAQKIRSHKAAITARVVFVGLIILIGCSRYFINVHYVTDILAGFLYGSIMLYGFIYLYKWVERKRGRRHPDDDVLSNGCK